MSPRALPLGSTRIGERGAVIEDAGVQRARQGPSFAALAVSFSVASLAIGVSFGIAGTSAGLPPTEILLLALLVFGGGAQFGALGVVLAGGSSAAAVTVGLLLNGRFLLMGVSVGMRLDAPLARRLLMAFLSIDASLLVASLQRDPKAAERDFWRMGIIIYLCWQVGTLTGLAASGVLVDTARFGFDALVTVTFIGLLAPLVTDRNTFVAMLTGFVAALVLLPLLPAGLPVLLAGLLGAALGALVQEGPVPRPVVAVVRRVRSRRSTVLQRGRRTGGG
jgi:predicted branched-subunit amino acid permease